MKTFNRGDQVVVEGEGMGTVRDTDIPHFVGVWIEGDPIEKVGYYLVEKVRLYAEIYAEAGLGHCEKPCLTNWSAKVDGEHDWGFYHPDLKREHCNLCEDYEFGCPGREYVNELIKEATHENR